VVDRFGKFAHRRAMLAGLLDMCQELRAAGAKFLLLDGSFVTKKPLPKDFDACYYLSEVDIARLNPVFQDFSNERATMKARFRGEAFPAEYNAAGWEPYEEFFQHDEDGKPKGIVKLDLGTLP
jgi:hypothetical protein